LKAESRKDPAQVLRQRPAQDKSVKQKVQPKDISIYYMSNKYLQVKPRPPALTKKASQAQQTQKTKKTYKLKNLTPEAEEGQKSQAALKPWHQIPPGL